MNKHDIRTARTRSALASALIDLMDRTAFEEIKVVDICQAAQVHRTTFYKHFEDKYQLLGFVVEEVLDDLTSTLRFHDTADPKEYYTSLLEEIVRYIHNNEKKFKLIAKNNTSGVFIHTLQNIVSGHIQEFMLNLQDNGYSFDVPIPLLARYRSGGLIASAYYLLNAGKNLYTVEEMSGYLSQISELTSCMRKE